MIFLKSARLVCLLCILTTSCLWAQQPSSPSNSDTVSTDQLSKEITAFLGREIGAHVADIHSFNPPQERVVGVPTTGDFDWGTFTRAVASYAALSGDKTIAGREVTYLIGQGGLIEARQGGKTFAQLAGALSLRSFGTDLKSNALWQSFTPEEQTQWRSLLDPERFYDKKTGHVINLPENYFGVAARIVSLDYQMGIITDRAFADDVLDRAADQFLKGNLYSDDSIPTGRYDRYSNEYARFVYDAAETLGREDVMKAMEPTLKAQMRTWWDLLSPDGYGYPWGRSLGVISYIDTTEIVAFLAKHPQFRPAPLPQLASAYYAAWRWLENDFQPNRHLLNVFAFGRGNYSYISPTREWQQTTAFFGKVAGAQALFMQAMSDEHITSFPAHVTLPEMARFEYFRKGDRPSGVWLVRHGQLRFALPITTGPVPGISDYLPAPYSLPGYAPPVQQPVPAMTPYLELEDGRVIVAGDGADEITPSADGLSLRVVWKRWAVLGTKSGEIVDPGITAQVEWKVEGNSLLRTEKVSASKPTTIRRFWVIIPTTGDRDATRFEDGHRIDRFDSPEGSLEVTVKHSDWPIQTELCATGNSAWGKGSRGYIPFYLNLEARNSVITPEKPMSWTLVLRALPGSSSQTMK
ncbi:MAG TPA: hypothetical protein VK738_01425 [Terriglobales bacterium]|jgi:hypothetical protein|nr:hypothetical protein [Terriglobales bacterium]